MTQTCTAQMRSKNKTFIAPQQKNAFTLTETMVAMVIVSLLIGLAMINLTDSVYRNTFRASAQRLVSLMQRAAAAAHQNGKRYEVIIDLVEQNYVMREISSSNLSDVLEEEIIASDDLPDRCYVSYVEFDDPEEDVVTIEESTETLQAKFRAGPAGWQYGGKIVLLDRNDNPHSIIVSTLSRVVKLEQGDVPILMSKRKDELPF